MCKEESQTVEHWLQRCPNLNVLRQRTCGSPSPPLGVLTTDPREVLGLRRTTQNPKTADPRKKTRFRNDLVLTHKMLYNQIDVEVLQKTRTKKIIS